MTAFSGVSLLVFAAVMLGGALTWERGRSAGILPLAWAHLIWSLRMLLLLPPVLGA